MIELTRLNGNPMVLNSDLIKTAEASPDTMLTLINGEKLIVRERLRRGCGAGARLPRAPAGRCGPAPAHLRRSAARVALASLDVAASPASPAPGARESESRQRLMSAGRPSIRSH
jgi:hypothetical protein